ncbi:MAG: porin family protein [Bacteroidales bacterium]|jgi:hypothetical protein|nr:porin family protein [Bacteroidales bacterium]
MKKTFITVAVALASITANAQFFAGGGLNLSVSGGNTTLSGGGSVDAPSSFSFGLHPMAGFYLNDKFSLGGRLGFDVSASSTGGSSPTETTSFSWAIAPFARYAFIQFGKLSIVGEAAVNIGRTTGTSKSGGGSAVDTDPIFRLGFNVAPLLSYSVSDRLNLELAAKFFSFGVNTTVTGDDTKTTRASIGFGANSGDLIGSLGSITVGAIFKF